jgi:enoyl-CoA hydratase/carnithine racemase
VVIYKEHSSTLLDDGVKNGSTMSTVRTRIVTDKTTPEYWRVTFDNPPINAIDDRMYDEFYDLVEEIEAAPSLKVVTFESANPDFFIAHYSTAEPRSRFGVPPPGSRPPLAWLKAKS